MVKKKKQTHYIDNAEFEKVIKGYLKNPAKHEERLIELLDLLITNILMSFKFNVDFDDAKQECFLLAIKTLKNFNPDNGAAFNYFTTVIVNNLKLIFTKNKKYRQKIQKYQTMMEERFSDEYVTPPKHRKTDIL
jgi:DNA-directed RNA polymerase specialized sigma subunit